MNLAEEKRNNVYGFNTNNILGHFISLQGECMNHLIKTKDRVLREDLVTTLFKPKWQIHCLFKAPALDFPKKQ